MCQTVFRFQIECFQLSLTPASISQCCDQLYFAPVCRFLCEKFQHCATDEIKKVSQTNDKFNKDSMKTCIEIGHWVTAKLWQIEIMTAKVTWIWKCDSEIVRNSKCDSQPIRAPGQSNCCAAIKRNSKFVPYHGKQKNEMSQEIVRHLVKGWK